MKMSFSAWLGLACLPLMNSKAGPFDAVTDDPALPRILLIGDSISVAYTEIVREHLAGKANVHRPSQNCGPTLRGLNRIDQWLGAGRWDVIHFNFGLHDMKSIAPEASPRHNARLVDIKDGIVMTPIPEYESHLQTLVRHLKKTGARLIWCNTTPVPEGARGRVPGHARRYNDVAAKVMNAEKVAINDLFAFATNLPSGMQRTGDVHFTPKGSMALGKEVARVIEHHLASTGFKPFPAPETLPAQTDLPPILKFADGGSVGSPDQWPKRRQELLDMLAHYVYGHTPPPPLNIRFERVSVDPHYLDGRATKKQIRIFCGPEDSPINLLLFTPNQGKASPVFLGLNFRGNHTTVPDVDVPLSSRWVRDGDGVKDNRATEKTRGTSSARWPVAQIVERGFAMATFYQGDIDPDKNDLSDGIHAHYYRRGQEKPDAAEWGCLAAWAWGLHRAVDYLVTDPDIDPEKIAVMGHSRNGKTALVAGAFDDRIALVVSNQSGCGGAAISRRRMGETVERINKSFPHWFNTNFKAFDNKEDHLPLDQHFLVAASAPRPVLVCSAEEDKWADPEGEFAALVGADPVHRLLGLAGLQTTSYPGLNTLVGETLAYHVRPGKHNVGSADWKVFMDFAEKHFGNEK